MKEGKHLFPCFKSFVIIIVVVIIEVEVPLDRPVTELDEKNLAASVSVGFSPLLLGIAHVDAPFLKKRLGLQKFSMVHSPIIVSIYAVEGDPQFEVLPQIFEKKAEFAL